MMEQAGGPRLADAGEYRRFYEERALPRGGHCWLMGWERKGGRRWASRYWSGEVRIAELGRSLPEQFNGFRASLAIGHLALQVIGELAPETRTDAAALGFPNAGAQHGLIFNIAPGRVAPAIPWPPPLCTDETGLDRFAERQIGAGLVAPVYTVIEPTTNT